MTALALARHRLQLRFSGVPIEAFALLFVALAVIVAVAVSAWPERRAPTTAVTVHITPAKAEALVAATTGTAAEDLRAVGDQAKLINAALPFSASPVQAAHSFAIGGNALDQRRALLCLTQTIYYEAGNEPVEGRRAVAQVVLNRMRHPAFPKSVCGVVYQGAGSPVCQFSFVCDGALYRQPAAASWRAAEDIARAALAGYVEASVGEATHYHADYVAPRWAPMLAKVAQLGQHIFYRWPGAWGQVAAFTGHYIGEPRDPLTMRPPPPALAVAKLVDGVAVPTLPEATGPPIARAANDVGGLLDTSKGWTLNIPMPSDSDGSAAKLVAAQEHKPAQAPQVTAIAIGAAPIVAAR